MEEEGAEGEDEDKLVDLELIRSSYQATEDKAAEKGYGVTKKVSTGGGKR